MSRAVFLLRFILLITLILSASEVYAAKGSTSSMNAEALGAKAFLEELLARRYSAELATKLDRGSFVLGAQLDLTVLPPVVPSALTQQEPEPMSDLMLGTLDPEALLKKYGEGDANASVQGFLRNFKIRTVEMSVGLKDDVDPALKGEIEKWLNGRLNLEFGKNGKGSVSTISAPIPKPPEKKKTDEKPKDLLDLLERFQSFAGQAVLGLALILGGLLWALLAGRGKSSSAGEPTVTINNQGSQNAAASAEADAKRRLEVEQIESVQLTNEVATLTSRLNDLLPRIGVNLEGLVRSWVQTGDDGRFKLACFAEAVGRDLGKLPIPVDAMNEVTKVFARMTEATLKDKRDALQKTYWDLLTALNLGTEVLTQPFGYLGGLNVGAVNQVLMDQNPKMKTLVSLFMPTELRNRYVKSLSLETKRELLTSAAGLSEIGAQELKELDRSIAHKLKPAGTENVVPLEMTLKKVVGSLTATEEVTLLHGMTGPAVQEFKRTSPSLAFLAEWPDLKLKALLARATSDEVVTLVRVRSDLQSRLLSLAPSFTSDIAADELAREDRSSESDKILWLESLSRRVGEMVQVGEISLEEIFPVSQDKEVPGALHAVQAA